MNKIIKNTLKCLGVMVATGIGVKVGYEIKKKKNEKEEKSKFSPIDTVIAIKAKYGENLGEKSLTILYNKIISTNKYQDLEYKQFLNELRKNDSEIQITFILLSKNSLDELMKIKKYRVVEQV